VKSSSNHENAGDDIPVKMESQ